MEVGRMRIQRDPAVVSFDPCSETDVLAIAQLLADLGNAMLAGRTRGLGVSVEYVEPEITARVDAARDRLPASREDAVVTVSFRLPLSGLGLLIPIPERGR